MDPFVVKLALSWLVGGLWITLTTVAAETLGSKLGGLIGGLPSTVVVALFFIGWTQGPEQARAATTALPVAFAITAVFLLVYVALAQRGLAVGIIGALAVWLALQGLLAVLQVSSLDAALGIWAVTVVGAYLLMTRAMDLRPHNQRGGRRTPGELLGRAVFSGSIVALAVTASRLGGPVLGAAMASFPAVYISTLVITARSVGVTFSRSLALPLMMSGVINCVVYGTAFRFSVLPLGLIGASLLAYGFAAISAYGVYRWLSRRA